LHEKFKAKGGEMPDEETGGLSADSSDGQSTTDTDSEQVASDPPTVKGVAAVDSKGEATLKGKSWLEKWSGLTDDDFFPFLF
jgi:hypothetical protein